MTGEPVEEAAPLAIPVESAPLAIPVEDAALAIPVEAAALAIPMEEAAAASQAQPLADRLRAADRAWDAGDRGAAVRTWRAMLEALPASPAGDDVGGPALEAMLRARLLPVSGNLAPMWLEGALFRALDDCAARPDDRWCRAAEADYELWMPRVAGADPSRVAELLAGLRGWAPADERVARAAAGPVAWPGSWVLGWGVSVVPGAGVGLGVHVAHPDVGWRGDRLVVDVSGDTLGGVYAQAAFSAHAGPHAPLARAAAGNVRGVAWDGPAAGDDAVFGYAQRTVQGAVGESSTRGAWVLSGGLEARWDDVRVSSGGPPLAPAVAVGPWFGVRWGGPVDLRLNAEFNGVTDADPYALAGVDARRTVAVGAGRVALRLLGQAATDAPFYRLPAAGGSALLRGEAAGRYRGPYLGAAQAEYRRALYGPVQGALFVDGAWVSDGALPWADALHVSMGGGVRLVLPPTDVNVTRVDVGVAPRPDGTLTWGMVVAWGQAF